MCTPSSHASVLPEAGVGVGHLHLARPQALDLAAAQHQPGLERLEDGEVTPGLAVAGDELGAGGGMGSIEATDPATEGRPVACRPMLTLTDGALAEMVAHAYRCYPEEACGLLAGRRRPAAG